MKNFFVILIIFLLGTVLVPSCVSLKKSESLKEDSYPFYKEYSRPNQSYFLHTQRMYAKFYEYEKEKNIWMCINPYIDYNPNILDYKMNGRASIAKAKREAKSRIAKPNNFKKFFDFLTPKKDPYPFYKKIKK